MTPESDRECSRCGETITLHDGREWPDAEENTLCWGCLSQERDRLQAELARIKTAVSLTEHAIEQTLGRALGYPPLYPDASPVDDGQVCVGDNVAETLAVGAAKKIGELRGVVERQTAIIGDLRRLACDWCSQGGPRDEHGNHPDGECMAWTDTEAEEAAKAREGK